MARQPADFHSLEAVLFSAREIAEELGEVKFPNEICPVERNSRNKIEVMRYPLV